MYFSPDISSSLLLSLVQLVDVGQFASIVVTPQDRVAVVAGSHQAILCQPQASNVGKVLVLDHCHPE